jgi:hypothetical protein
MQLGDLVAYALYRGYSAADWGWANRIVPAMTSANPKRLVHFTNDTTCSCPAWTRR